MKIKALVASSFAVCALVLAGCGIFGLNPAPPTALEKAVFKDVTNYVPVVVQVTNTINQTNEVIVNKTNEVGVVVTTTNQVVEHVQHVTEVTNVVETHTLTPNPGVADTAGTIANYVIPGSKGIVTLGLSLLLGIWGHLRSYKGGQTSGALSQEVETLLEFINALPNGTNYYNSIIGFLRQHQEEAGVSVQVLQLLKSKVNNADAKVAAQEVIDVINGLGQPAGTTPIAPVALVDK